MKTWTEQQLIDAGYEIKNAQITGVSLNMSEQYLTLSIMLKGNGWGVCVGGYNIGCGYVGADEFVGCPYASEYIMRILDTVGVSDIMDVKGKYVRVATKEWGDIVKIFGNIIKEKWFDCGTFFSDKENAKIQTDADRPESN